MVVPDSRRSFQREFRQSRSTETPVTDSPIPSQSPRRKWLRTISIVLLVAVGGWMYHDWHAQRDAQLPDAFEAVFRHMFANSTAFTRESAENYVLEVQGEDPGPEFLNRFAGHSPPIFPASETGFELSFHIGEYSWTFDGALDVEAGYFQLGQNEEQGRYTLVQRDGRWLVTDYELIGYAIQ